MNYYIWFLTAALLNPAAEVVARPDQAVASNWVIYHNEPDQLKISHYLYNRSHHTPLTNYFTLPRDTSFIGLLGLIETPPKTTRLENCSISFTPKKCLKIIDGHSYLYQILIEHDHRADLFDGFSGFIEVNNKRINLEAAPRPKAEVNFVWPEIFNNERIKCDMVLNYNEFSDYDDYYYNSGDYPVPPGTKLLVEFDYAYSYDSEGATQFKLKADSYKGYDQYNPIIIIEETLKRPKYKMWNHYERQVTTPNDSICISIGFLPLRPAKIYSCFIKNFKITPIYAKD